MKLLQDARAVDAAHHMGLLRQAFEIWRAKRRNPGLDASDYFTYRLYDRDFLGASRVEDFIGSREAASIPLVLNVRTAVAPAWDRFMFAVFANAFGLPTPRLRALYRPGCSPTKLLVDVSLDTRDGLAAWLRTRNSWPLAARPCYGDDSSRSYDFTGYRADQDVLLTRPGEQIAVDHFTSAIVDSVAGRRELSAYKRELGYVFHDSMRPHPKIAELLGSDTPSSVRVILLQDESGIEIVSACWQLASDDIADGDGARTPRRTIVGYLDPADGRSKRVVAGRWPDASLVTHVRATGRALAQFTLPDWQEALALCRRAAPMLPLMRIQHWDLALTDAGPQMLGVKDMGSMALQAGGSGLRTPRLEALLRRHGGATRRRWPRRQ